MPPSDFQVRLGAGRGGGGGQGRGGRGCEGESIDGQGTLVLDAEDEDVARFVRGERSRDVSGLARLATPILPALTAGRAVGAAGEDVELGIGGAGEDAVVEGEGVSFFGVEQARL